MTSRIKKTQLADATISKAYRDEVQAAATVAGDFLLIDTSTLDALKKKYNRPVRGLGDIVSKVAQPIARVIDKVAGTDIEHCGGCAKRRDALNNAFPLL